MSITDDEQLIINIEGKTMVYSKEDLVKKLSCANHDRDTEEEEKAVKADQHKTRMELLPPFALEQIARVFTYGANKYESWNYIKNGGLSTDRVYGALLRHINERRLGRKTDLESGEKHLAHAGACVMMLIELEEFGKNINTIEHYESE